MRTMKIPSDEIGNKRADCFECLNLTFQRLMFFLCAKVFAQINNGFSMGLRSDEVNRTQLATFILMPCLQIGCIADVACVGREVIRSRQDIDWIILSRGGNFTRLTSDGS